MRTGRLIPASICLLTTLALASPAGAQEVIPPGNSAANQYTEPFPTAGGNTPTKGTGKQSPANVLGHRNAHRLEAMGPQGRAAAEVAAATAPSALGGGATGARNGQAGRQGAGGSGGGNGAGAQAEKKAAPSGSSGLGQILRQATGTSSSGGTGLLLPLILGATGLLTVAYALYRRRSAAD
jgi:hypothetical protein